jgi:antitoxin HicB
MNLKLCAFAAAFTPELEDGGFVVTFRDFPEAITQGDTIQHCLSEASDCLAEALAARIDDGLEIPLPCQALPGEYWVPAPLEMVWKAELHYGIQTAGITPSQLAEKLQVSPTQVSQLLNPRYDTDLTLAKKALNAITLPLEIAKT